jgi:hypothetical protein
MITFDTVKCYGNNVNYDTRLVISYPWYKYINLTKSQGILTQSVLFHSLITRENECLHAPQVHDFLTISAHIYFSYGNSTGPDLHLGTAQYKAFLQLLNWQTNNVQILLLFTFILGTHLQYSDYSATHFSFRIQPKPISFIVTSYKNKWF